MSSNKKITGILILALCIGSFSCDLNTEIGSDNDVKEPDYIQKRDFINNTLSKSDNPLVQIVYDSEDDASKEIIYNIIWTLKYTKIPYHIYDVHSKKRNFTIPASVRVVCLGMSNLKAFSSKDYKHIVRFIADGNTMIVVQPVWDRRIEPLIGIDPNGLGLMDKKAEGIYFNQKVLPGLQHKYLPAEEGSKHDGYRKDEFGDGIKIMLSAANDTTYPVLTENKIGSGTVDFYNTYILSGKRYRGLIFSSIIEGLKNVPYLTANVSSIFLDDFPQPLYNYKSPPIKTEYDVSDARFVSKIWWPDMLKLARRFKLKYTAMLVFNYNSEITPPFDFKQWLHGKTDVNKKDINASLWLSREARYNGVEMGFHGYNHISLLAKNWGDERYMKAAIETAKKRWKIDAIGKLPVTYVPPNDYIDSVGIQSLLAGMPSIKYLCSLYTDEVAEGNGREFDLDPYSNKLFDYPRISSGYVDEVGSLFNQQSLYIYTGIWTHFIHPDDVYDLPSLGGEGNFDPRNIHGLGWHKYADKKEGLYEVFEKRLADTKRNNPLIRYETVDEAVPKVIKWRGSLVEREFTKDSLLVSHLNLTDKPDTNLKFWYVYVPQKDRTQMEKAIRKQSDTLASVPLWNGYLYQFSSRRSKLMFPFQMHKKVVPQRIAEVANKYDHFFTDTLSSDGSSTITDSLYTVRRLNDALSELKKYPDSLKIQDNVLTLAEAANRLYLARHLLQARLTDSLYWNKKDVDHLLNLLSWQNDLKVIWKYMEERWQLYPDIETIRLKQYISQRMGEPSSDLADIWSRRALQLQPDNDNFERAFIKIHQTKDSWPETKRLLLQLIQQHPRSDSLYFYTLKRSFWYDQPRQTLDLIQKFPKSSYDQLTPLAKNIADCYIYNSKKVLEGEYWASLTPSYDRRKILQKLLDQKRYRDFNYYSWKYLDDNKDNDTLRAFVGRALLDQGEINTGLRILYPLYRENKINSKTAGRINTEMSYLSNSRRMQIMDSYPEIFTRRDRNSIIYRHRLTYGFAPTITTSFADDNFNNTIKKVQISSPWVNNGLTQQINLNYYYVGNRFRHNMINSNMTGLWYGVGKQNRKSPYHFMIGGGLLFRDQKVLPDLGFEVTTNNSAYFTSIQLNYQPVLVNPGLSRGYRTFKTQMYNEIPLISRKLLLSQGVTGNWFSDDNLSIEWLGKMYVTLAARTKYALKPLVSFSYATSKINHSRGIPYWSPYDLTIKGTGVYFEYQLDTNIPKFNVNTELMVKDDNQNGTFMTANFNLETLIAKYWRLKVSTELSTSKVYRYNRYGFAVSYYFPAKN